MFTFGHLLRLFEIFAEDLQDFLEPSKSLEDGQKSAGLKTILDFATVTEFKGFLDISFSNWEPAQIEANQEFLG